MGLSECLTNIRNLEGIIDFENCIYFAGKLFDEIIFRIYLWEYSG